MEKSEKFEKLRKRIVTAILCIIVVFFVIIEGRFIYTAAVFLFAMIALGEFSSIGKKIHGNFPSANLYAAGILLIPGTYLGIELLGENYIYALLFLSFLITAIDSFVKGSDNFCSYFPMSWLGVVYIPFFLAHLILIRMTMENAIIIIWFVFIVTWITDIGAYFIGSSLGKNKLSPKVSPNKTWEGAIGGGILGFASAVIMSFFSPLNLFAFIFLGFLMSIAGQFGDLVESCLKRKANISDTGTIFPGHGGALDRCDSLLFNIPLAYYFLSIFL